jgi:hypothetical protein
MAQITHADHDEVMIVVHAQDMADLRAQFFNVVPISLLSELSKAAEVLSDLGGGDIHFLPQRVGGDPNDTPAAKIRQLAVIAGQPPNDGV